MKAINLVLILAVLVFIPAGMMAQTKFEREYRIKEKDVPEPALEFAESAFGDRKIRWYAEESQDGNSIEAKVRFNKTKFSVEFDNLGNLQDVEKSIKFKKLEQDLQGRISQSLNRKFGDFKIQKVQIQWTAENPVSLKELIRNESTNGSYTVKYEIVIETKADNTHKAFEVLIDRNGTIEKSLEQEFRDMNNMEF